MTRKMMIVGTCSWILPLFVVACIPSEEVPGDDDGGSTPCLKDTDCKGDRLCLAGMCTPIDGATPTTGNAATTDPADPPEPCQKDTDCKGDRLCVAGYCEAPGDDTNGGGSGSSCFELGGKMVCSQAEDPGPSMAEMSFGTVPPPPGSMPASASLDLGGFTVPNQGACGSCVAFAVRSGMGLRAVAQTDAFADFSPAHIWYIAGYGADDCDSGSGIWKVVGDNKDQSTATVTAAAWPYDVGDPVGSLDAVPAAVVLAGGLAYVEDFVGVGKNSALQAKYAIAQNWPPVIGVPVYQQDWQDGDIDLPANDDTLVGYHAITLVSYDDQVGRFGFVNSWGPEFGVGGFGTMSYAFVDQLGSGGVAIQQLKYGGGGPVCGDGVCSGDDTQANCCEDCGCPQGSGCEGGMCVAGSTCGDGAIDPGESCDGATLGGASCQSAGYDDGNVSCKADCMLNTATCCNDECVGGSECLDSTTVHSCGNFDGDVCLEFGGSTACPMGQVCTGGQCGCGGGDEGQFEVLSEEYPSFGSPGCAGDNSLKLKASAEMISPTKLRLHVRKEDDTAFGAAATLSLYVGEPIKCPDPVNVVKATQPVAVGQTDQVIDLTVNPYGAAWPVGETKKFWVGKNEGPFNAFRATGLVSVKHVCSP